MGVFFRDCEQRRVGHDLVSVRDTGPGIGAETLGKLLQGTYTPKRSQGGTGLGLLISRHVFEAHGERLAIESTPGAGTTIRVTLPMEAERTALIG